MISLCNIQKTFGKKEKEWALGPVSFSINPREFVAMVGTSGSGKSTLLHIIGGLLTPDSGDIVFSFGEGEEKKYSEFSERERDVFRNQHIGFVFQEFFLLPEFSLLENVAFPLLIQGKKKNNAFEKAKKILSDVGLFQKIHHRPAELSGGQKQRGALARALVHDPDILLADEPTGNLDEKTGEMMVNLLQKIHEQRKIIFLLVTHDEVLAKRAERSISLENGKILP